MASNNGPGTTELIEITYADPRNENQNDPAFYTGEGHTWVATLKLGTTEVGIFCDGEMRINDYGKDYRSGTTEVVHCDVIRYADRLIRAGIDTDEQLSEATESGRFQWVNNSWLDLYDLHGEWLDIVTHDLSDAILAAVGVLNNPEDYLNNP